MLLCGTTDWRTDEILNWKKFKNEVTDLGLLKPPSQTKVGFEQNFYN
jgi:hypothetical protein